MQDSFWASRQKTIRQVSIPWITRAHDKSGGLEEFRRNPEGYVPQTPIGETEVIKLVEAMASIIGVTPDPGVLGLIDAWIQPMVKAQGSDGYLGEHFPHGLNCPPHRWEAVWWSHEDYTIGHYIEAAISYREATGSNFMYQSALRAADNMATELLDGEHAYTSGHPEIEQALMRLYSASGNPKYLQLCGWLLNQRGNHEGRESFGRMRLDDIPIKQQRDIQGHAVMAGYLFNGVTNYVGATGDAEYQEAVLSVWDNLVNHKMYIHGGGGNVSSRIEGYRRDSDCILPDDAYCESCSIWANFQWAHSLFRLDGNAKYINTAEMMLYNAFYASLSLRGDSSYYTNVTQADVPTPRSADLATSCCPPNIVKLFSTVGGYFYSTDVEGVFVKHYGASEALIPFREGIKLIQKTNYPWDGRISILVHMESPTRFSLRLRSPDWAYTRSVRVNGRNCDTSIVNGWITIARRWMPGDVVDINFPMHIRRISMPMRFAEYHNRVALTRGPIIYCLEEQDVGLNKDLRGAPIIGVNDSFQSASLETLYVPEDERFEAEYVPDLLGGATVLKGNVRQLNWRNNSERSIAATFVPYGLWANRTPGAMRIWLGAHKSPLVEMTLPEQEIGHSCVG
jgi:DUF1680 family protein